MSGGNKILHITSSIQVDGIKLFFFNQGKGRESGWREMT